MEKRKKMPALARLFRRLGVGILLLQTLIIWVTSLGIWWEIRKDAREKGTEYTKLDREIDRYARRWCMGGAALGLLTGLCAWVIAREERKKKG